MSSRRLPPKHAGYRGVADRPDARPPSSVMTAQLSPTEVAIAVLFGGDPETGESSMDVFRSDDETSSAWPDGSIMDVFHRAQALRASVGDDFPSRLWSIAVNDEARRLMRNARMRAMGFVGEGYEEYTS